mgnify:CR=1 FL=1
MIKIFGATALDIVSFLCSVYEAPTECKAEHCRSGTRLGSQGPVLTKVYVGEWAL